MARKNNELARLRTAARKFGLKCLDTEWRGAHARLRCAHGLRYLKEDKRDLYSVLTKAVAWTNNPGTERISDEALSRLPD